MKKAIFRLTTLAVLAGGAWYGYRWYKSLPSRQEQIATTKVQRGDVVIRAYTRGELHAVRAITLVAPNLNGTVQVTRLAPAGAMARVKDLIIEYDDSELLATLDEDQMALQKTDEQIKGAKATLGITDSQDALSLLKQRYAERSAELNVRKNPVIDLISAKKNLLALEQAKRSITQLESDIAMRKAQNDSVLAVLNEQRNRNLLDLRRDQNRLAQTKELAQIEGLVSIRQNRGGNFNFGQVMPDIRPGDTLQPGMQVADILDLSEVEVWAKVGELDRANLTEGQDVSLQLDSIPDKSFHGKIKTLSGTATADVFSGDPSKKFDVVFSVDMRALLSGLGMKPADVERIMAAAASNAQKNINNTVASLSNPLPLTPQGTAGAPGAAPGSSDEDQRAGGPGRMRGGRRGGQGREADAAGGGQERGRGTPGGGGRGADTTGGRGQGRATSGSKAADADSGGGRGRGGRRNAAELLAAMGTGGSSFTEEERNNAKLPLPPDQDSQVQVLLRPGLLADVTIAVENLPNVIHVPAQAVFQKGGTNVVYVQQRPGSFTAREVRVVKRSESMMVLGSGVEPGDIVALADPTADRNAKKESKKSSSSSNPMSSMPGGK
jgi:multidrug resistance efflux pump